MASTNSDILFCPLGGSVANAGSMRYAWRAPKNTYKNIASGLGVTIGKDTDKGLFFGANRPKPARVRISYNVGDGSAVSGIGDVIRSTIRFCSYDNLNDVLTGGGLKGKKIFVGGKQHDISNVSLLG